MPRNKSAKSTPTKAQVNCSDNSPTNTKPGTNSSNADITTSASAQDTADDLRLSETINRIFSKKLLAIPTGRTAILKKVKDWVIRNDNERLKDISCYIYSLSVKYGCLCIDGRLAILKAFKDAVLDDIHSTHPGSFAMLFVAQNM